MLDTTQMGTLHKCGHTLQCSGCANHIIPMGQAESVHTWLRLRDESLNLGDNLETLNTGDTSIYQAGPALQSYFTVDK